MTAVEIKVLSTHAALDVLNVLGPKFERAAGCRLSFGYDPAKAVKRQVENGAAFDVAIVTRPVFDDLVAQGKMLAEPRADVGRSGLGVSVRQGAAKPDIATTDAFKRALLAADTVVRSTEGTSGIYFDKLIGRLGIGMTPLAFGMGGGGEAGSFAECSWLPTFWASRLPSRWSA